ncbi:hypothetical protein KPB2_5567 [Klebsiella pneumoniae Kb677]|nr:hypothetical protein KPB2_5567 [Klebsiella pneumoniae Kb677]
MLGVTRVDALLWHLDVAPHLAAVGEKARYSVDGGPLAHISGHILDRTMRLLMDSEGIPIAMATGFSFLVDERSMGRTFVACKPVAVLELKNLERQNR